ncbi:hypothetical protein [Microbulbifer variabilis]|uniref:hypothetical protein n=1 Tax=Microbulbifer variabilis TaxID=266805 RepID=UPI001CFEAAD3|nr:hypothetical protein [Microbulbifer variabilis]
MSILYLQFDGGMRFDLSVRLSMKILGLCAFLMLVVIPHEVTAAPSSSQKEFSSHLTFVAPNSIPEGALPIFIRVNVVPKSTDIKLTLNEDAKKYCKIESRHSEGRGFVFWCVDVNPNSVIDLAVSAKAQRPGDQALVLINYVYSKGAAMTIKDDQINCSEGVVLGTKRFPCCGWNAKSGESTKPGCLFNLVPRG